MAKDTNKDKQGPTAADTALTLPPASSPEAPKASSSSSPPAPRYEPSPAENIARVHRLARELAESFDALEEERQRIALEVPAKLRALFLAKSRGSLRPAPAAPGEKIEAAADVELTAEEKSEALAARKLLHPRRRFKVKHPSFYKGRIVNTGETVITDAGYKPSRFWEEIPFAAAPVATDIELDDEAVSPGRASDRGV